MSEKRPTAVMCGYQWRDRRKALHTCYLAPDHQTIHVCTCGVKT